MSELSVNITSPVGRLVSGSLYKPNTTDSKGNPLVYKKGPQMGQPRIEYSFGVAIPKTPGHTHFTQTDWGQKMLGIGAAAFPNNYQRTDFSWKVQDGDSTVPNKNNKIPNQNEGWPGHWVLFFNNGFPPKIYNRDGSAAIVEPDAVKRGYYVQVNFDVKPNSGDTPGIYVNPNMVALSAYGPEMASGPDVASAGFGAAALPAGASATPLAPSAAPFSAPAAPAYAPPVGAPAAPFPGTGVPTTSPSSVVPNPGFLQVPPPAMVAPPAPAAPVAPAPTGPVMTPAANGVSYAAYVSAGWSHQQMVAAGMVVA
jgi:hypothetical protein